MFYPLESGANICTLENDTGEFWNNKKPGLYYLQGDNQVHGQPAAWTYIINIHAKAGTNVAQFALRNGISMTTSKSLLYRSTNSTGTMPSFLEIKLS